MEKWKTVDFLDCKYEVSDFGRIRNSKTKKIKCTPVSKRGYPVFSAQVNGKMKLVNVHKCVAVAFIPNPDGKPQINHIDGNKLNNYVSNLEWATSKENMNRARNTGLHTSDGDKPVIQIKDGVVVNIYKSLSEASRQTGINRGDIGNVCRKYEWKGHHSRTAGGFEWKFV